MEKKNTTTHQTLLWWIALLSKHLSSFSGSPSVLSSAPEADSSLLLMLHNFFFKFSNQLLLAWNFKCMKLIFSIFLSKSTSVTTWIFCKLSGPSMLISWTSLHILRGRWTEGVLGTTHWCSHVAFSTGGGGVAVACLVWGARTKLFPDQMIWESQHFRIK